MTESIGIKLHELLGGVTPFYFAEAQVESYPYAVYDLDVTPFLTKDGIHHYEGSATINIYDTDLDNADAIADAMRQALKEGMDGQQYSAKETFSTKTCIENVWDIQMTLLIKQYR